MNYITHLNTFFATAENEEWLTPYHQSLYLVLFRLWNQALFKRDLKIYRDMVMEKAKIGSKKTYYTCLKDLHAAGYLCYYPSKKRYEAASVAMIPFDKSKPVARCVPDEVPQQSTDETPQVPQIGHLLKHEVETISNQTTNENENDHPNSDNNDNNSSRRTSYRHESF